MDGVKPLKPGVHQVSQEVEPGPPVAHVKTVTLADLAADFIFFTPALIVAYGPFLHREILLEDPAMRSLDSELQPKCIDSLRPFFTGIPQANGINWNHRIYMMPRDSFEICRTALSRMVIARMAEPKSFSMVSLYTLPMPDPNALIRGHTNPLVDVEVFAVTTLHGLVWLSPPVSQYGRPYVRIDPVENPVYKANADAWLGGQLHGNSL